MIIFLILTTFFLLFILREYLLSKIRNKLKNKMQCISICSEENYAEILKELEQAKIKYSDHALAPSVFSGDLY